MRVVAILQYNLYIDPACIGAIAIMLMADLFVYMSD